MRNTKIVFYYIFDLPSHIVAHTCTLNGRAIPTLASTLQAAAAASATHAMTAMRVAADKGSAPPTVAAVGDCSRNAAAEAASSKSCNRGAGKGTSTGAAGDETATKFA